MEKYKKRDIYIHLLFSFYCFRSQLQSISIVLDSTAWFPVCARLDLINELLSSPVYLLSATPKRTKNVCSARWRIFDLGCQIQSHLQVLCSHQVKRVRIVPSRRFKLIFQLWPFAIPVNHPWITLTSSYCRPQFFRDSRLQRCPHVQSATVPSYYLPHLHILLLSSLKLEPPSIVIAHYRVAKTVTKQQQRNAPLTQSIHHHIIPILSRKLRSKSTWCKNWSRQGCGEKNWRGNFLV